MDEIHISLAAETLTHWFGIPITNTLVTSWVVMGIVTIVAVLVGRNLTMIPGKVQTLFESMIGFILEYMEETLESKKLAERFFPLIMTLFIFIFAANILEFTPGIGSIGFFPIQGGNEQFVPLFRSVNTDINVTLALAIISFLVIELSGIFIIGFLKYFKRFVNLKSVLGFSIGIIELFSEIARLISFSFRLFGNIFAGEVLILVAVAFMPILLPVPLMLFEVFIGFIQAAIFSLLTLFFIKIAVTEIH